MGKWNTFHSMCERVIRLHLCARKHVESILQVSPTGSQADNCSWWYQFLEKNMNKG